ncbi:MAG: NAD(P)/FAD-dependent oxidoreductase [Phycisphaerae bacterium]|nr:NAD(P)/FAD-dependent oxidoreductase [Phycisphaerae bacterium]
MTACDVIVIGGGHNGLVTAAALAGKGRSVLVLERHATLGGLAVGDEFHPGYTSAGPLHDTSTFAPALRAELDLDAVETPPAVFTPQIPDAGPGLLLHRDPGRAAAEIGRQNAVDANRYADYRAFIDRVGGFLTGVLERPPPTPDALRSLLGPAIRLRRLGRIDMLEVLRVAPMCVADWLKEHFESELLSSTLAVPALAGTRSGPWSPGTAANLLRSEALTRSGIRGGAATLIDALVRHARDRGVAIRTEATVTRLRTEGGRVVGVTLADGETIDAPIVAASCDPKHTQLELLAPATLAPRLHHRMTKVRASGAMAIVDLALSAPLRFGCRPELDVAHARVVGTIDDMERAFDATKYGRVSAEPILEVVVPTVETPSLAPPGHHVASIMTHFAPYDLDGGWTGDVADTLADTVIARLATFASDLPSSIVARRVRTPVDLETRYGVTGGHIHHVEHALDQLIVRPDPECARYATPVAGLYLCGSGAHPGGGLTGLPGMLAAEAILGGS